MAVLVVVTRLLIFCASSITNSENQFKALKGEAVLSLLRVDRRRHAYRRL